MRYPVASAKNANAKPELVGTAIAPITTSTRDNEIRNTLFMVTLLLYYKFILSQSKKVRDSGCFITRFSVKTKPVFLLGMRR